MTQDILIKIFAEQLKMSSDNLDEETSPDNTTQWDSLAAISLVLAIEETFKIKLSTREVMKARSIGLVRDMLKKKGIMV